ncbi:hypothetical protein [Nocardioides albus]|uniref:Uncharacterized protein n=1 Tax=Nocardioides albus TaxID=1841 RepID=A0A7W5FBA6_9ACTN|nr:hypothetical protein [Nocardioides albus]MBB3092154.1 hypothetical protein [Nocardioides albus]GGU46228.1 hypothetical protein GCM10007979_51730 [Nocardioides albus]
MSDLDRRKLESLATRANVWAVVWLCIAGGAGVVSLLTYTDAASSPTGGYYIIWWGPVAFGVWLAIKNAIRATQIRALLRQVGSAALPQMSSSAVPPKVSPAEVAPSTHDPQTQDPQTIVRTSADYVSSSWSSAKRSDLTRGWLSLVATPRGLRLKFKADTGTSWALYASKIYEVALVAKGPNVIIEIVFKHPGEPVGIRTIVGPKGRIGEICRLLGHPIL